jgi:hypothetical protein
MKASVSGNTITLRPAGGTYQVANKLRGNQGEDLFSGRWGFKVVGVQRGPSFQAQYTNRFNTEAKYEALDGEELVIVSCRLKNGTPTATNFAFSSGGYGMNTALTDQDAGSYQPAGYDVFADENAPLGKAALPGASIPFNIIFRVPKSAQIKILFIPSSCIVSAATRKAPTFASPSLSLEILSSTCSSRGCAAIAAQPCFDIGARRHTLEPPEALMRQVTSCVLVS